MTDSNGRFLFWESAAPFSSRETVASCRTLDEVRQEAAKQIRAIRRVGIPVRTVNPGSLWTTSDPGHGIAILFDLVGTLRIDA